MIKRKVAAFRWRGGKYFDLPFILPFMPRDIHHFIDVFGGSAAVIINMPATPIMTYNDIDGEIVNFFRVLRNSPQHLITQLLLTPYSREEYGDCLKIDTPCTPQERARRFYVRMRQTMLGMGGQDDLPRRLWARVLNHKTNAELQQWLSGIDKLREIADIFQSIQIENEKALDLIRKMDSDGVFFYCDPPYVLDERRSDWKYKNDMTDAEHEALAGALGKVKARVMVSGYPGKLYDRLFAKWRRFDSAPKIENSSVSSGKMRKRAQSVWINYEPPTTAMGKQTEFAL